MWSLKDFQKQLKGSESFENSIKELRGEFLIQSSQDYHYDDLLSLVRSLGLLPEF